MKLRRITHHGCAGCWFDQPGALECRSPDGEYPDGCPDHAGNCSAIILGKIYPTTYIPINHLIPGVKYETKDRNDS